MPFCYGTGRGMVHRGTQPLDPKTHDNPILKDQFMEARKTGSSPVRMVKAARDVETKVCTRCGQRKPLSAFWRDRSCPDGRRSSCADCCKARKKELHG